MLTDLEQLRTARELARITDLGITVREALVLVRRAEGYAYPNAHPKTKPTRRRTVDE